MVLTRLVELAEQLIAALEIEPGMIVEADDTDSGLTLEGLGDPGGADVSKAAAQLKGDNAVFEQLLTDIGGLIVAVDGYGG
jgi:hypothetical protein